MLTPVSKPKRKVPMAAKKAMPRVYNIAMIVDCRRMNQWKVEQIRQNL